MVLFLWLIFVMMEWQARIRRKGFFPDYIGIQSIQPVKGVFLLLVFASHFIQYVDLRGVWDAPYFQIRSYLGQMVVVPFLFYSGYGIAESFEKKGRNYLKRFPKQRILKVLFQFDIAVVLFLLLRYVMGNTYTLEKVILTLIGWDGIGNSNWYIFAIMFLYTASWLSYTLFAKSKTMATLGVTFLVFVFVLVMMKYKDGYWYNTAFAYTAGMWYSHYRNKIEKFLFSTEWIYWICLAGVVAGIKYLHPLWSNLWIYEIVSVLFAAACVMITMKVQITNRFLSYCGEHLFSLFILQRLPMIALNNSMIEQKPVVYFALCFIITLLLSAGFDRVTTWLWNILFSPKITTVKNNG